MPGE
jgi:hypothetical protein